jgi:hypothetical protein
VIGLIQRLPTPGVTEVVRDHDLRSMPPNSCADRAAQLDPVLQHPVGQPEKVNHLDSDDPDAGFAAGHHGIHHGLSLISPASDRRRGTEFKIIWVGDDAERGVPRLVDRFEIWHAA